MIKISRLADYSVILLNLLATTPQQCYSAAALAQRTGIALPTVSKVLKLLNEAQVIVSSRGVRGGYRLAREPEQTSLADIITAVDGQPALTECCQWDNHCIHDTRCALRSNWQLINQSIVQMLSRLTLANFSRPLTLKNGEICVK